MTKFLIEAHGEKFEVEAPDAATAAAAFTKAAGLDNAPPSAQERYDAALKKIHETQFQGWDDEKFARYAADTFKPYGPMEMAQQGQTFGLTDEIDAGLSAFGSQMKDWFTPGDQVGYGDAYNAYSELEQARRDLGKEQMGGWGTAAEVAGGLLSMNPVAAIPAGANAVAPSMLKTVLTSGATGGGMGAIYGLGATDGDLTQRGEGALKGGLTGAAVGVAAPAIGAMVGEGIGNIVNRGAQADAAAQAGMSPGAARFLTATLGADDALGLPGQVAMRAAGGEAMLADAGQSARNALDYAVQSSGAAGRIASTNVANRVSRDSQAIEDVISRHLGTPQGVETTRASIRNASGPARGNTYDAAYAQPIDYSSNAGREIETLLQRVPPAAIQRANNLMRINGEQSAQIMAQVADDGTVTFQRMPDVRQLDYITRALNTEAEHGIGAGAMGGQTDIGSALQGLSRDIRDVLRSHVPEYDAALNLGADTIRQTQAVARGAQVLRSSTTREQVREWVRGATQAERQAFAQGIRSQLDEALANVTRTVQDGDTVAREAIAALRTLSSRANREKVALVIGDGPAAELFSEIDRAARSFDLRAAIATNSKTFARQEMGARINRTVQPDDAVGSLLEARPAKAAQRVVQSFTGRTPERAMAEQDAIMAEIARALTRQGGAAQHTAQSLATFGQSTVQQRAIADAIRRAVLSGGVDGAIVAGGQYGRPQQGPRQ